MLNVNMDASSRESNTTIPGVRETRTKLQNPTQMSNLKVHLRHMSLGKSSQRIEPQKYKKP